MVQSHLRVCEGMFTLASRTKVNLIFISLQAVTLYEQGSDPQQVKDTMAMVGNLMQRIAGKSLPLEVRFFPMLPNRMVLLPLQPVTRRNTCHADHANFFRREIGSVFLALSSRTFSTAWGCHRAIFYSTFILIRYRIRLRNSTR